MRFVTVVVMAVAVATVGQPRSLAEPETSTESTPEPAAESAAPSSTEPTPESSSQVPSKSSTGGHEVTYTITATSDLTGNISYIKADPPSKSAYNASASDYLETVRVPISGGKPLVYTATLADPGQWALVTASGGLRINPEFHCEIAIDGKVVVSEQGGSGVTCSTQAW